MRESCLDCIVKHLGQAYVLLMESILGYLEHRLLVIGHLAEASEEAVKEYPELAKLIRQHRTQYQKDALYEIPFFDIYEYVMLLASLAGTGEEVEVPDIPEELYPLGYKNGD